MRGRSITRERAAARWPRWSALLRTIGESYARLHYDPRGGARSPSRRVASEGVEALPAARTLGIAKPR
jgi:hypothetical protein